MTLGYLYGSEVGSWILSLTHIDAQIRLNEAQTLPLLAKTGLSCFHRGCHDDLNTTEFPDVYLFRKLENVHKSEIGR